MTATTGGPCARALAGALKQARQDAGYGLRELARKLGMSHTTLSYWETAQRLPRTADLGAYLAGINLTGQRREHILTLAERAHEAN